MDPLSAIGLASAIVQFVDFGSKIVIRLQEFSANVGEIPEVFRDITIQLPLLLSALTDIASQAKSGKVEQTRQNELRKVIVRCQVHIKDLNRIIKEVLPAKDDSLFVRSKKAILSVRREDKVKSIVEKLEQFKSTLTLYQASVLTGQVEPATKLHQKYFEIPSQRRVSRFIGRESILQEINTKLHEQEPESPGPAVLVLTGMGGQGKTQIALKYCHQSWQNKIFRVKDFERFANVLEASGPPLPPRDSRASSFRAALEMWADKWLLILDNLDSVHFQDFQQYLPNAKHGTVIVTCRYQKLSGLESLRIPSMSATDALKLLLVQCEQPISDSVTREGKAIVEELGYLPLAIVLAGSYIKIRNLPLTVFRSHYSRRKREILDQTAAISVPCRSPKDPQLQDSLSVFTSWELALNHLSSNEHSQAEKQWLLSALGFLSPTGINEELFEIHFRNCEICYKTNLAFASTQGQWDSLLFQDVLAEMRNLALLESLDYDDEGRAQVSIHPLVSGWIRMRLDRHKQRDFAIKSTLILGDFLDKYSDKSGHLRSDYYFKKNLLSELDFRAQNEEFVRVSDETLKNVNRCTMNISVYVGNEVPQSAKLRNAVLRMTTVYMEHARFREAQQLVSTIANVSEAKDELDFRAIILLGLSYFATGYTDLAKGIFACSVERIEKLSPCFESMRLLLLAYYATGCFTKEDSDEARAIISGILQRLELREWGARDQHNVFATRLITASVLLGLKDYAKADSVYEMLATDQTFLLPGDYQIHLMKLSHAQTKLLQGKAKEAQPIVESLLQEQRQEFSLASMRTGRTMLALAECYRLQKHLTEAESLYKFIIDTRQGIYGNNDNLITAKQLLIAGKSFLRYTCDVNLKDDTEATKYFSELWPWCQAAFHGKSEDSAAYQRIATILAKSVLYCSARPGVCQSMKMQIDGVVASLAELIERADKPLGNDMITCEILLDLAETHCKLEQYTLEEPLREAARRIRKELLGDGSSLTWMVQAQLTLCQLRLGKRDEAKSMYQQYCEWSQDDRILDEVPNNVQDQLSYLLDRIHECLGKSGG
ncbi:hypothetical protein AOQ84DRAFT_406994 [Glonium stellatum]|uniref:NACHT-NTPase and P-loop NTPases N-terminal domain-containing protein n=1 Tax=Glonium stellatum TaxID=574774 RepID=A0A8E2F129_9PEZI|nr:hypothetical protein AOQ84DRAFT_406994 [Glonium stellatum]